MESGNDTVFKILKYEIIKLSRRINSESERLASLLNDCKEDQEVIDKNRNRRRELIEYVQRFLLPVGSLWPDEEIKKIMEENFPPSDKKVSNTGGYSCPSVELSNQEISDCKERMVACSMAINSAKLDYENINNQINLLLEKLKNSDQIQTEAQEAYKKAEYKLLKIQKGQA
jgi:hypothetical protein